MSLDAKTQKRKDEILKRLCVLLPYGSMATEHDDDGSLVGLKIRFYTPDLRIKRRWNKDIIMMEEFCDLMCELEEINIKDVENDTEGGRA